MVNEVKQTILEFRTMFNFVYLLNFRCVFGLNHQTIITHVALTHDALYFTTKYGEAFIGNISRKATLPPAQPIRKERERDNKSALVKFLEKDDCTSVRITKIPNVHRAVEIAVDSEGLNFACLQVCFELNS